MNRQIPKFLSNFSLFVDGFGLAASAVDVKLPELNFKTKEHQGGGMFTPADIIVGLEKLDLSFGVVQYDPALISLFGKEATQITFRGHARGRDNSEQVVVAYATGIIKTMGGMEHKPGDADYSLTFSANLTHFSLEIDGAILVDIDVINSKCIIGGEDRLAGMAAALGLS